MINKNEINLISEAIPSNEIESNNRIQVALQGLYEALRLKNLKTDVPIMENHESPKTVAEQRDLICEKIISMKEAVNIQ